MLTFSTVVQHLKDLFWQLEWSEDPAVKPELELAKLALVTSKDEEDEVKSEGSDATNTSSVQSGSTLVDEPMPMGPLPEEAPSESTPPEPSSSTVLGKRPGENLDRHGERRHTTVESDGFVVVNPPQRATTIPPIPLSEEKADPDVEMGESSQAPEAKDKGPETANPPPLPPRKKTEKADDGVMMFGMFRSSTPNT